MEGAPLATVVTCATDDIDTDGLGGGLEGFVVTVVVGTWGRLTLNALADPVFPTLVPRPLER